MTIKKVRERQHSDTVVLVICPLTSIIQDQVKEEKLDCAALKHVKDMSNVASDKTQVLFASGEEAIHDDFWC